MFAFMDYIGQWGDGQAEKSLVLFCFRNKILHNVWISKIGWYASGPQTGNPYRGAGPRKPRGQSGWSSQEF
jgi:hypothetical protein